MTTSRSSSHTLHGLRRSLLLSLFSFGLLAGTGYAEDIKKDVEVKKEVSKAAPVKISLPTVFEKTAAENIDDLKAIQKHVKDLLPKLSAAVVGITDGRSSGSGVIISEDGYVLTAGHVSAKPDREVTVIFPDGKRLKAKTLGQNVAIDSGLIKITEEGKYPCVEMGESNSLKKGQWCVCLGHPGGFQTGRTPVLRLGRMMQMDGTFLRTDCTLVGGDSGGPLFDMEGKVIGIHSRIGGTITQNMHVPVNTFRETWERLVKGESWGGRQPQSEVYLGIKFYREGKDAKIQTVDDRSPAQEAGFKTDDVITKFEDKAITSIEELSSLVREEAGRRGSL